MNTTLAIVIPVYNEEELIEELRDRLAASCGQLDSVEWEVLFVNDGSSDTSLEKLKATHKNDARFKVINLSRNFGHQAAISAGVHYSEHDLTVIMDADLQDPPELIPKLLESWRSGNQIVRAVRKSRAEGGVRGALFKLFHYLFKFMSDFETTSNTGVFCLMDRKALVHFKNLPEKNRYLPALRSWIGFQQGDVHYDRQERAAGEAKQSFTSLFKYAADAILSFSYKPLRLISSLGLLACLFALLLASTFIIKRLLGIETAQTGFTTLVTLILFFGGANLTALGVLGEYLARVYDEVKQRPSFIVDEAIGIE